jgi:hypothetical protein
LVLDRQEDRVQHTMVINRQVHHIGWSGRAQNQFAALAGPANAEEPSEVVPNA